MQIPEFIVLLLLLLVLRTGRTVAARSRCSCAISLSWRGAWSRKRLGESGIREARVVEKANRKAN
jgi:hypothetical protein